MYAADVFALAGGGFSAMIPPSFSRAERGECSPSRRRFLLKDPCRLAPASRRKGERTNRNTILRTAIRKRRHRRAPRQSASVSLEKKAPNMPQAPADLRRVESFGDTDRHARKG